MNATSGIDHDVDCVWGSVGIIYCLFTIIANGLLVYIFVLLRRKESVTDIIFLQLAVLDCLSGFAGLFGSIFLVNERRWFDEDSAIGDAICYPAGMLWNIASLTTPLLLSSASIGRFLAVYCPFAYEKYFRSNVVKGMIVYCWSHGFIGATISFTGPNKDVKGYQMFAEWGYCDQAIYDSYDSDVIRKVIYITLFTVPVIVSCTLIIVCNLSVAVKILIMKNEARKKKKLRRNKASSRQPSTIMRSAIISLKSITRLENMSLKGSSNQVAVNPILSGSSCTDLRSGNLQRRDRKVERQRRKENQAMLMTILLSINYFICYIEIIHYYVTVSIGMDWEQSYIIVFKNVTYVYLWYYFSLFFASGNNAILHLCFNPNVKGKIKSIFIGATAGAVTTNSSI